MPGPVDEQIRERAYRLWEEAGSLEGKMDRFWYAAEQELKAEGLGAGKPPQDNNTRQRKVRKSDAEKKRRPHR